MSSNIQNTKDNLNNAIMVLTIDIGNGICDKLRIFDINNYQEETYDFCAKNNLDFNTMKEINHQIQKVISDGRIFKKEIVKSKYKEEKSSIYVKKTNNKLDQDNYLSKFRKKKENDTNKKVIKRYNEKPYNFVSQKKDSNKSNYSSIANSSKANSGSTKGSSIKDFNIKASIKNAFHTIKGNSERSNNKNNIYSYNNKSSDIKSFRQNSSKNNLNTRDNHFNSHFKMSEGENNDLLFIHSHNKKINDNNKNFQKVKESIAILNQNDSTNKKDTGKKDEMMIIEFDSCYSNNSHSYHANNTIKEESSAKKTITNKFNDILNSITLIDKDYNKFINPQDIIYRANKTEANEQKTNLSSNLTNKSDFNNKSKKNINLSSVDKIKIYKKLKEEKIKNLKELKEIQFHKLYTFRPLINKSSATETNQENNNKKFDTSSRFEKLYDYRISYKENKKKLSNKYEKKYPFHPKINSVSSYPLAKISFNERLKLYSSKSKDIINKIQKSIDKKKLSEEKYNQFLNTERHPNLLKKESYKKQSKSGKKFIERTKLLTDKNLEEHNNTASCRHINNNIFNLKKENTFKKIFKLLDNGEGKISFNNMNIKNIPIDIKYMLEPIITELKETNENLTEPEFIFVCNQLYDTLKLDQKQKLLLFGKKEENKSKTKEKPKKENNSQIHKTKSNSNITAFSSDKGNKNLNRLGSCETDRNKNKLKRNNEIKKINYYFSKPKYMMQINNFINEDKKIRENKNAINNISLSAFLKNKSNEKDENRKEHNIFNISNLVVQNISNKIDKEIKFRNYDNNDLF